MKNGKLHGSPEALFGQIVDVRGLLQKDWLDAGWQWSSPLPMDACCVKHVSDTKRPNL